MHPATHTPTCGDTDQATPGPTVRVVVEGRLDTGRADGTQAHIPATDWTGHMWLTHPQVRLITEDAEDSDPPADTPTA